MGHGHVAMRQGPHVLHDVMLGTQDRADPVARVVVELTKLPARGTPLPYSPCVVGDSGEIGPRAVFTDVLSVYVNHWSNCYAAFPHHVPVSSRPIP